MAPSLYVPTSGFRAGWTPRPARPTGGGGAHDHLLPHRCASCGSVHGGDWPTERVELARQWLRQGGSVLLYGPGAEGCSGTLDEMLASGTTGRVLRCDARADDRQRPLHALARLLSWVDTYELAELNAADHRVVASLMYQSARAGRGPRAGYVSATVMRLFAVLAATAPLLLVVRSAQWLDPASVDVLQHVADRVAGLPVQMIVTDSGIDDSAPIGHRVCTRPLLVLFGGDA